MKGLLCFFLLIFPLSIFANEENGSGAIMGNIMTADDQAAPNVAIWIKNTDQETITDDKGNFEFKKIKPGTYILRISLVGYIDSAITVEVKEDETLFLKVQLRETYNELKNVIVETGIHPDYVEAKTSESLRLNLPLIEVPQNIVVVMHKTFTDQGLLSLTEAIRTVSGVVETYGGLNDYELSIRGTDAPLNIFRNGVGGYSWNQQEDIAMLEKIEFIKGPAGFMISMAEPGGIINNVTKQPVKEPIANVNAVFGSYKMIRLTADLGGSLNKSGRFFYRFNAGIQNQERAFQFSKASKYFICAAITYEFNKKTSLTAECNDMYAKTMGNNIDLPSLDGKMFALPRNFAVADHNTDKYHGGDKYYRVHLKHDFNDNWHLNAQAAYIHGVSGNSSMNANGEIPVSNDTLYRAYNYSDWRKSTKVAQAFVDGKFYTSHRIEHNILSGIDYCSTDITAIIGTWGEKKFGLYIPNPNYYINPDSLKNFEINPLTEYGAGWVALYLQDHIKIAGKLVVTLAGHLSHSYIKWSGIDSIPVYQQNTKYKVFTPRAGLTWLFAEDISVYALYDQCFVPIGFSAPPTTGNIDNKQFKPITGYNIETGMKGYFFKRKLSLSLSTYHIVKNNTVTGDPLHYGHYIQTGQITSNGIELDMTGNITPGLTVNTNYAYTDARVTKDTDPKNVGAKNYETPDHACNLWMKYNLLHGGLKNISFAMGYQYMGKRSAALNLVPGDVIKFLPVYNLLDAALSYSNEKFNISLNVYNITNTNYAATGYYNPDTNEWRYTPGESVNFRLSFGVNLEHDKKK